MKETTLGWLVVDESLYSSEARNDGVDGHDLVAHEAGGLLGWLVELLKKLVAVGVRTLVGTVFSGESSWRSSKQW